jgi:hypothetical protein
LSIPRENRSSLGSGDGGNNQGLRFRQVFRNLEAEPSKAVLIELTVEQAVIAEAVYLFLQQLQMRDGNHSCLIAMFSQTNKQFIDESIHNRRKHVRFNKSLVG